MEESAMYIVGSSLVALSAMALLVFCMFRLVFGKRHTVPKDQMFFWVLLLLQLFMFSLMMLSVYIHVRRTG